MLFTLGFMLLLIFGGPLLMSLDGADGVLRATRLIGIIGVGSGLALMCVAAALAAL